MPDRILVIAPHSDDAELGCGGYMAKRAQQGAEVHVLIMALGDITHLDTGHTVRWHVRLEEADAAAKVLGAYGVHYGFVNKDTMLDTLPLKEVIGKIEGAIADLKPREILLPLPSAHQDHEVTHRAAMAACRPRAATRYVEKVLAYEYPATGWGPGAEFTVGRGGMYVDISEQMDLKREALNQHHSQMRGPEDLISTYAADALARLRGVESACEYAELLHVIRLRA
jgi:LmbE family N-acetylglucosaminyl deacetylase